VIPGHFKDVFSKVPWRNSTAKMRCLGADDPWGREFALFLCPHPRALRQLMCPYLREFAHFFLKNSKCPEVSPGNGHCWN